MEKFKIENWEKNNENIEYTSLKEGDVNEIIKRISKLLHLPFNEINNNHFFVNILNKLNVHIEISDINECNTFPKILSLLNGKVSMETNVYLVWSHNSIDKITLSCLSEYWDYIWYGPSDEMLLLYFDEYEKILLITDYGVVYS